MAQDKDRGQRKDRERGGESEFIENTSQVADSFIDAFDAAEIILGVTLIFPTHEIFPP